MTSVMAILMVLLILAGGWARALDHPDADSFLWPWKQIKARLRRKRSV